MENLRIYGRSSEMGSFCQFCKKFKHTMEKCPMINLVPNKIRILEDIRKIEWQERKKFERRIVEDKMKNSLRNHQGYAQILTDFVLDQNLEQMNDEDILDYIERLENQDTYYLDGEFMKSNRKLTRQHELQPMPLRVSLDDNILRSEKNISLNQNSHNCNRKMVPPRLDKKNLFYNHQS